jgi:hypothetical protein
VLLAGSGPLAPALSFVRVVLLGILVFHDFLFAGVPKEHANYRAGRATTRQTEVAAKFLRN